ncbi:FCD domain-containing protein, partial [Saccharopolyspora sp. NPDC002686]|uniref:FadR/GntR family transcriptional regulator n=1 Tax=Saccharopolyspora sp. NPDC002686 TaxID=3154541 RepID=UPI00332BF7B3
GVSRAAVREAFRALEAQGVLRMAVGTGPDSGTTVAALPSQALTRLLRLHVALANFPMADVVRARIMLERESARNAAQRATEAELDELGAMLDEMDSPDCDRDRFSDLDTRFHVAIAEAGGNRLVADMTIAIRESLRGPLREAFDDLGDEWSPVADGLRHDHRQIYQALVARDSAEAEVQVERHIRSFYSSAWRQELG